MALNVNGAKDSLMAFLRNEPAVIFALVGAGVTLAVSFGLHLTVDQTRAIMGFALALVGLATRQVVTPTNKAPDAVSK